MTRLLVVEDNQHDLELITQLLEDDFALVTARDGAAGLEIATRDRPDLILMDLSLPVLDGWEAIGRLRATPEIGRTPIVVLSARASRPEIDRALAVGCDAYVTKPIDEDELRRVIAGLLAGGGSHP